MSSQEHMFAVDGFLLTGTDPDGSVWTVETVTGWHDGPGVRSSRQPRAQQSGDMSGTAFRTGRQVVLSGKVFCSDTPQLESAARALTAVLAGGGQGDLVGLSRWGQLSARVRLEDAPRFEPLSSYAGAWQLTVASDDPLLYGDPVFLSAGLAGGSGTGLVYPLVYPRDYGVLAGQTPGSVVVPNAGTAAYWPRLRIDGPVPNPVVTLNETGDWVRFNGTVSAGQWLDFDLGVRRVLLNGQVSLRQFVTSSGRWLMVPPGGGSVSWAADGADPAATLSVWSYEGAWS